MTRLKMFACAETFALLFGVLIVFFEWEPLVGIGLFMASIICAFTGIIWLMVGPEDMPNVEHPHPDLSHESIDEAMRARTYEIYKDHLEGKHESGTMLHQICEVSLEPAKMHAAFMEKYGKPMSDPSMGNIKKSWEDSWIKYKIQIDSNGVFGGLTYEQAGVWRRVSSLR